MSLTSLGCRRGADRRPPSLWPFASLKEEVKSQSRSEAYVLELGLEAILDVELGVHSYESRGVSSETAGSIRFIIPLNVVR